MTSRRLRSLLDNRKYKITQNIIKSNCHCSVFIMPPQKVYKQHPYYKATGKIPGDLYYQGKIVKLGDRMEDVESDNAEGADVPQVSSTYTCLSRLYFTQLGL